MCVMVELCLRIGFGSWIFVFGGGRLLMFCVFGFGVVQNYMNEAETGFTCIGVIIWLGFALSCKRKEGSSVMDRADAAALVEATGSRFSDLVLIGRGSFGDVYKGWVYGIFVILLFGYMHYVFCMILATLIDRHVILCVKIVGYYVLAFCVLISVELSTSR